MKEEQFWKEWDIKIYQRVRLNDVIVSESELNQPKGTKEAIWKKIQEKGIIKTIEKMDKLIEDFSITLEDDTEIEFKRIKH